MSKIRVGIVGCGEVAQIIHIPALQHLADKFEVTALCDISASVLEGVSRQCGGAKTFSNYAELVADGEVDAVVVANPNPYHAHVAIAALENGKHVLIEKPMCMTYAEADTLAEAERKSGGVVQVGYMRRHAGAFLEAVDLVQKQRDGITFARVQDIIGQNALIIDDTSNVIRDRNIPEADAKELATLSSRKLNEAIGVDSGDLANTYNLLLGLSSHDLSAMRELLGKPRRVLHAATRANGRFITALFDYGDFVCEFATGVDRIPRFDAFLEVYTQESVIRVDYETPYIRNLPARLTVLRPDGDAGTSTTESFPSRLDSFVIEWEAFHEAVTLGNKPKTTIADAREDLDLFQEIIGVLKASDNGAAAHG